MTWQTGIGARHRRLVVAFLLAAAVAACAPPDASSPQVRSTVPPAGGAADRRPGLPAGVTDAVAAYARALWQVPGADAPLGAALRDRLTMQARGAAALGVDLLELTPDPSSWSDKGAYATVDVVGRYRLRHCEPHGAPAARNLTLRRAGGRWVVDAEGAALPLPWDVPGMRRLDVGRGPGHVVVIGSVPDDDLRWVAAAAADAWAATTRAWPRRPEGAPVVVAPATVQDFARLVRAVPGKVSGIAAYTVGSLEHGRTARGDQVVLNPDAARRLTPEGRKTILRHELVHVAIRGTTTGTVPQWLTEGYATQASWDGGTVPAQLRERVRRWPDAHRAPDRLPTDAEVDSPDEARRTAAYDGAALLVDDLVRRRGRTAVIAFYEALAAGSTLDEAAREHLGEAPGEMLAGWRAAITRAR